MTAAPKYGSLWKLHCRDNPVRRALFPVREAGVLEEELGECTRGGRRGMGPSAYARSVGIMSGRASSQQGLATTCEDHATDGITEGAGRDEVWRMSPYERRRRGNALRGDPRGRPERGNARLRQRGSGHSAVRCTEAHPDIEPEVMRPGLRDEGTGQPGGVGLHMSRRMRFRPSGKACVDKRRWSRGQNRIREIRPSGIAGGPG
jgi:hypothetical protein